MQWSERASTLLAEYVSQGKSEKYIRKSAETQARNDESPVVYRTHVIYVREAMK